MTSALQRSPSQVRRESRRFEALKAQRARLLAALEAAIALERPWADVNVKRVAREAIHDAYTCEIVPLEDPK